MRWRKILGRGLPDDDDDPTMRNALQRLDDLHERAEKVTHRINERDRFAEDVAALFRGERPTWTR